MCLLTINLSLDVRELIVVLKEFQELEIQLKHIESRPPANGLVHSDDGKMDYYLEFNSSSQETSQLLMDRLREITSTIKVATSPPKQQEFWFPRHISEVHHCCTTLFKYGSDLLTEDHPGYGDTEYMERRRYIAEVSKSYKYGDRIPDIDFTPAEIKIWGETFRNQTQLYPTHACKEYNTHFPKLFSACCYREDNIPRLEDVSRYLKAQTGWQLWPVIGWISSRDFLNALAFRVFPTTQYIRHHSSPFYTPEPDICHELMGHAPLFCDPVFAQFSQEIGLASLGISDEWMEKLATLYWFTVEFGMVEEGGKPKAYGAGLLSSNKELQNSVSETPEHRELDMKSAVVTAYPETGVQPVYFVAKSMEQMRKLLLEFTKTIPREFNVYFDPYTQSVKVLDDVKAVEQLAQELHQKTDTITTALKNLSMN